MAQECSFDIVSTVDLQEVENAVNQTMKEIRTRYDLKDSKAEVIRNERELVLTAEDDFRLRAVKEILGQKLARRAVPLKALAWTDPKPAAGSTVRQTVELQNGIAIERARQIVSLIKGTKLKVQAQIMGDQLRVRGRSRDDLQQVIQMLREKDLDFDIQFVNYRT
jgi:hypothetical protein